MKSSFHYFSVGDEDLSGGLYLTSYGCNIVPPNRAYPGPGHPRDFDFTWAKGRVLTDTALIYISEGEGLFEQESGAFRWKPRRAVLLPPGVWHRYRPQLETGWTEFWLTLSGEWMGRFWQKHAGQWPVQPMGMRAPARFTEAFSRFCRLASRWIKQSPDRHSLSLLALALQLVGRLIDEQPNNPPPPADDLTDRARRFILSNSHRQLDTKLIASALGVSRRTLERRFAGKSERSLREELEWHRAHRAMRLLLETRRPIKEIAYLCGFSEQRGLIRAFKRWHSQLPSAVRR
ncbi:MAG: AraC family transcriptional regulator [Verrucomicrobiota bacterium]